MEILHGITAQCAEHRHEETGNCSHSLSTGCVSGLLLSFCGPDSSLPLCRWTGRKENMMAIPVMCLRQLLQDVSCFLTELCSKELNCILQSPVVPGALCLVLQVLYETVPDFLLLFLFLLPMPT